MKEQIIDIITNKILDRREDFRKGKLKPEMGNTDYLSVFEELSEKYSLDEVVAALFGLFGITSLSLADLSESQKSACKLLISSLYELEENDYSIVNPILDLFITSIQTDTDHFVSNNESSIKHTLEFNKNVEEYSSSSNMETKNHVQSAALLTKAYVDICEGIYSNALTLLVFHIDVITGKKRTFEKIANFKVKDKLTIVENFDSTLKTKIERGYSNVIRNASSHKSYEIKNWPNIKFVNTDNQGNITTETLTEDQVISSINSLFSISNAIYTSETLKGVHKCYVPINAVTDFEELIKKLDKNELKRLIKNGK